MRNPVACNLTTLPLHAVSYSLVSAGKLDGGMRCTHTMHGRMATWMHGCLKKAISVHGCIRAWVPAAPQACKVEGSRAYMIGRAQLPFFRVSVREPGERLITDTLARVDKLEKMPEMAHRGCRSFVISSWGRGGVTLHTVNRRPDTQVFSYTQVLGILLTS